jgi:hypothetical protein|eukprot:Tamp_24622.p1 GENE.Tamp_24622~~Tamp_24622.p1  ORF type:complete len:105 (+),score=2.92 Tamp_24622:268-582(+)
MRHLYFLTAMFMANTFIPFLLSRIPSEEMGVFNFLCCYLFDRAPFAIRNNIAGLTSCVSNARQLSQVDLSPHVVHTVYHTKHDRATHLASVIVEHVIVVLAADF